MNEKDAIEIIIEAFEDARGSILFRDEIQAVNYLEDYVQNSISKDKIREKIEELEKQEDWYIENKGLDELYGQIDILKELLEEG